jgi:hypothetical protein
VLLYRLVWWRQIQMAVPLLRDQHGGDGQPGVGGDGQGDVPGPTRVRANLVMVQPYLPLGGLEALLHRPAHADHPDQIGQGGSNLWGVQVFQRDGVEYVAASGMDYGLTSSGTPVPENAPGGWRARPAARGVLLCSGPK